MKKLNYTEIQNVIGGLGCDCYETNPGLLHSDAWFSMRDVHPPVMTSSVMTEALCESLCCQRLGMGAYRYDSGDFVDCPQQHFSSGRSDVRSPYTLHS